MMRFEREINDFKSYLTAEKGLAKNTLEAYLRDLQCFLNNLPVDDVKQVTTEHIKEHLAFLREDAYASSSVARALITLKVFFRFLKREDYISSNIALGIDCPKIARTLPQILSAEEVDRLLKQPSPDTVRGACDKAVFELIYGCGLRVSELCTLNLYDVDDEFVRVKGKGGKERLVPLGKFALQAIDYYLLHFRGECKDKNAPLFADESGKRLSRITIWHRIKEYARKAGIVKNISPHTLRHAFATHLLDNGADLRVIQEMMGHGHISSTDRYMHLSKKKLQEKFYACHPRN